MAKKGITLIGIVKKVITFLTKLLARRVITLYIDDISLRLLVVEGREVAKWATLPLEPGLVKDGVVLDRKRMAAHVNQLLNVQRVKPRKIVVGLSGMHCLFRLITLPKLSGAMLAEAIKWEATRALPVPVEEFYIQWQIIPVYKAETQVFLVALPRNAIDALMETLREVGIKPDVVDLAPLTLARAASMPTAIIIDVRSTEVDIVIMIEGIPQLIRTLSLPSKPASLRGKLPKIRDELTRTINFYDSSHPEKPLGPGLSILASGELGEEPEACQSLAEELDYPVLPLSSALTWRGDLAPSQYMVNIGLALKKLPVRRRAGFSLVNLNVLPEVYRPKPIPLTKVLFVAGIAAGIFVLVFVGRLVQTTTIEKESLQNHVDVTYELLKVKQEKQRLQKEELAELQKQVEELEVTDVTLTGLLDDFSQHREKINGDVETVITLTSSIELSNVSHAFDELTITGKSPDEMEVLTYVNELKTSGRFSQVLITTMAKGETDVSFTLTLAPKEDE